MYLRFRYRLGFEALCVEVADSLAWRRFCRIPLGERVPHPTTLMKITTRCGEHAVSQLNEVLLTKAHEEKLVRLDRVRADTTVVEANVAYPTDSGLLAKGVAKMGVWSPPDGARVGDTHPVRLSDPGGPPPGARHRLLAASAGTTTPGPRCRR